MRNFVTELGIVPSIMDPIPFYCDSSGAIAQDKEPRAHSKSKNVHRKYRLIREIVEQKDIVILKIDGQDNIADPLTKALPPKLFDRHVEEMGLRYHPDWH